MTIGKLSGQCDFGQKGQSYCNQRGQSCVAKRVKVAWLFQPSLEECPEDIIPLAEFFRERFSKELKRTTQGFTEETKQRMLAYRWPGNVRELRNRVKRAVLVSESPMLDVDGLEITVCVCRNEETDTLAILPLKGEAFEKESIIRALKACNGHREQAAGMLNINPATLYRKMKKYGLK